MSAPSPLLPRRTLLGAALAFAALPARGAEAAPPRLVSIGGAVTEILYALGLGERIAAVDTTSVSPPEALRTKPNVGYMRQLSAEGILSARPTLVIASEQAGPPDALKLVREAGIPVVSVTEEPSEAGVLARVATVAEAAGRPKEGESLASEAKRGFADLAALRAKVAAPARALFILSLQNGRTMVGGRHSTAAGMLALAGATNVADGLEGYKPMTDEAIVAAAPEVVVMMRHGPGGEPPADLFESPALSRTPAAKAKRLVVMDGLALLGFGPGTPKAARELLLALHPGTRTE
jgi:iron complex transport system substrate-binding protein